jgi:hypothetical protein
MAENLGENLVVTEAGGMVGSWAQNSAGTSDTEMVLHSAASSVVR